MIKVKYERYWNDTIRKNEEKTFPDLGALADWIFGQIQQDYADPHAMSFPTPEKFDGTGTDGPGRIQFRPAYGRELFWIHLIRNDDGIIFSDGTHTSGQKHWNAQVKEWLAACDRRRRNPEFDFVDGKPAAAATEDGKSTLLIHLDYGDGEHGYVLYRVPADRLDEAGTVADAVWRAYDRDGRQGCVEEAFEDAFRQACIPFACEAYEVRRITA